MTSVEHLVSNARPGSWIAAIVACAALCAGCSLVLGVEDECTRDSDCTKLGAGYSIPHFE